MQKVLRSRGDSDGDSVPEPSPQPPISDSPGIAANLDVERLVAIRDRLASALYD